MPDDTTTVLDYAHAGLLIAAHGSSSTPGGRTSSRKHANTIRKLNLFADVRAAFLTEKPFIKDVLDDMTAREVYVVPNLACAGFISTTKLPGTLNLTGTVTERVTPHGHQRVFLTVPVGTAPSLPKIMANRILTAMETMAVDPNETAIILIGHGSQKSRESFEHTNRIAEDLARQNLGAPIMTAFLEEGPFIRNWQNMTNAKTVIFVPFLISDGYHGSDEIPRDIGFDAKDPAFQDRLSNVQPNELHEDGRRLIYLPPIGDVPEMAELILSCIHAVRTQTA